MATLKQRVEEEKKQGEEACGPKNALFATARLEKASGEEAEGHDVENGDFEAARGAAIPFAADEIDVPKFNHWAHEDEEDEEGVAHPFGERGRDRAAEKCGGDYGEAEYGFKVHGLGGWKRSRRRVMKRPQRKSETEGANETEKLGKGGEKN